ncbi:MAG TPA: hypothetical protein VFT64_05455 [Rickettsiales bacterium]|nr:hypothetical protein [Rickettsiales bacterium]
MTSQKKPYQKVQDDKYSHDDPERLQRQNKTENTKKIGKIIKQKQTGHKQD